jgi:hypothetical protein
LKADRVLDRYPDLAMQRRLLQAESTLLRHSLQHQASRLTAPVWSAADKAQAGARWLQAHPAVVVGTAGLALALAVRRPAMALSCLSKGLAWWRAWHQLSR